MKYLSTILGNHKFDFNGTNIIAWGVVGNETICISLDNFGGELLRFKGKFTKVNKLGIEGMQKFLESKVNEIEKWLPKSLEFQKNKDFIKQAKIEAEQKKAQIKIDKDRAIPLIKFATAKKGTHEISIATQPYECSVYVAMTDSKFSSLIQLGFKNHKTTNTQIEKILKKFEVEGYKVKFNKQVVTY